MNNSLVSTRIVVPTLGIREDWLRLSLESVRSQDEDLEIVVVGPHDDRLQRICAEYSAILIAEKKSGLSAAINQGVAADLGARNPRYVAWLGDDDVLAPGSVRHAVAALDRNEAAPFAFGRIRYIDAAGDSKWLLRPGSWAVAYSRWGHNFVGQPGSLIRRHAWDVVGGLDEGLRNSMDQDLFLKLARLGRPVYVASELAAFRVHPSSISSLKASNYESGAVAERYRDPSSKVKRTLMRVGTALGDRILLSVHCRIPGPSTPLRGGRIYTKPAP